jgi:hypothetical protein
LFLDIILELVLFLQSCSFVTELGVCIKIWTCIYHSINSMH